MINSEAYADLEDARAALNDAWDAEPSNSRRKQLYKLIRAIGNELTRMENEHLQNSASAYEPLQGELDKSTKELKWARNVVETFQIATDRALAIVKLVTKVLPLLI